MPDITMCTNISCPLRDRCYRFMAEPKEFMQSVCRFEPVIDEHQEASCEMFIKMEGLSVIKRHGLLHYVANYGKEVDVPKPEPLTLEQIKEKIIKGDGQTPQHT